MYSKVPGACIATTLFVQNILNFFLAAVNNMILVDHHHDHYSSAIIELKFAGNISCGILQKHTRGGYGTIQYHFSFQSDRN